MKMINWNLSGEDLDAPLNENKWWIMGGASAPLRLVIAWPLKHEHDRLLRRVRKKWLTYVRLFNNPNRAGVDLNTLSEDELWNRMMRELQIIRVQACFGFPDLAEFAHGLSNLSAGELKELGCLARGDRLDDRTLSPESFRFHHRMGVGATTYARMYWEELKHRWSAGAHERKGGLNNA